MIDFFLCVPSPLPKANRVGHDYHRTWANKANYSRAHRSGVCGKAREPSGDYRYHPKSNVSAKVRLQERKHHVTSHQVMRR